MCNVSLSREFRFNTATRIYKSNSLHTDAAASSFLLYSCHTILNTVQQYIDT